MCYIIDIIFIFGVIFDIDVQWSWYGSISFEQQYIFISTGELFEHASLGLLMCWNKKVYSAYRYTVSKCVLFICKCFFFFLHIFLIKIFMFVFLDFRQKRLNQTFLLRNKMIITESLNESTRVYFGWYTETCRRRALLDLQTFPHWWQVCDTPSRWVSMWRLISCLVLVNFPRTAYFHFKSPSFILSVSISVFVLRSSLVEYIFPVSIGTTALLVKSSLIEPSLYLMQSLLCWILTSYFMKLFSLYYIAFSFGVPFSSWMILSVSLWDPSRPFISSSWATVRNPSRSFW